MVVLVGIFWFLIGILSALRFDNDKSMSLYELTRLSNQGDKIARDQLVRIARLPEIESLRLIVVSIVSTLLVTSSVFTFGLGFGVVLGAGLLIAAPILVRIAYIRILADRISHWLWPYVLIVTDRTGSVLRLLRPRDGTSIQSRVYSQSELTDLIRRSPGVLSQAEGRRLEASLEFDSRIVNDIMTPKSQVVTADVHDTLGPLVMSELHNSGHSRYPVIDGDIDHVVGVLYLKEMIDLSSEHQTVREAMDKKVYFIRQDQDLEHALHGFLRTHHHLFVVINEYRETVGVLSLEDVIEALIGCKIIDEFDQFDDLRAVAERESRRNNRAHHSRNI